MSKRFQMVIAGLVFAIVIMACGSSSDIQVNTPGASAATDQQQIAATSEVGTTRSNPAPAGSEVVVDDMAFTILSTIRPADDIVAKGNMFNSTPEAGQEYMFVEVQITCKKTADEKCSYDPSFSTKVIGSKGIEYDPEILLAGVEKLLSSTDFYGDAVISGYIPFIVSKDETDFVMVYDPILGGKFYLAVPEPVAK